MAMNAHTCSSSRKADTCIGNMSNGLLLGKMSLLLSDTEATPIDPDFRMLVYPETLIDPDVLSDPDAY